MTDEHVLRVMGPEGDVKTIWDPDNPEEVKIAEDTFNKMKAKKYIAYEVKKGGEPGEIINKFDPKAGKIILCPPITGG